MMKCMRSTSAVECTLGQMTINLTSDNRSILVANRPHRRNHTPLPPSQHARCQVNRFFRKIIVACRSLACRKECKVRIRERFGDDLRECQFPVMKQKRAMKWLCHVLSTVARQMNPATFLHALHNTFNSG